MLAMPSRLPLTITLELKDTTGTNLVITGRGVTKPRMAPLTGMMPSLQGTPAKKSWPGQHSSALCSTSFSDPDASDGAAHGQVSRMFTRCQDGLHRLLHCVRLLLILGSGRTPNWSGRGAGLRPS